MEEKKDYLVSVKAPFTLKEFEVLNIAADDIKHEYWIMHMYLITLNENQVAELKAHENVKYVEEDKEVSTPEEGRDE
ncbi:protease inhibitor I9 family protein [Salinicoccus carnicancri]|uniref:protease inhibitor I9 family protein n=1 Tax=Salinicoccus carnicancri TaxID=558170 RepID=UPI00031676A8|nr:protease inhibitor I9 family protein [Salinicoccus carnicancri]